MNFYSLIRFLYRFGCMAYLKGSQSPRLPTTAGGDDTIFLRRQAIFLGYCFKHVTGGFVAPWVAGANLHR